MRHLAIGDIHGCFGALTALAASVPIRDDDLVIALGDYVDRGPDSRAVLDWLIERDRAGTLVAIRGNHEIMMLEARIGWGSFRRWFIYGGDATLSSYAEPDTPALLTNVPEAHWRFLIDRTRGWFETDSHFFVHANAYPDMPLADQPDLMLYWELFDDPPPHESGKVMVCGHTAQKTGLPLSIGHAVCLDTWVYGAGWLTCLDVGSGRYWQANRAGETRRGWLNAE